MLESAVEMPVVRRAEAAGWLVRKLAWVGRNGAPDRIFMKDGRVVFIEFKKPGEVPTLLQRTEHERMRAAGMEVYVCDDATDALRKLGIL